jgi:anhydro-N-acetylmuramic acid kinase
MSGTSVDSIDAAAVCFDDGEFTFLGGLSQTIPPSLQQNILNLCQSGLATVQLYAETDNQLGELFAQAAVALMAEYDLSAKQIRAIGSHGQTVLHSPPGGKLPAFSQQIGDPNIIAARSGCPVVADFRRADMAHGGHGAPLVPAFHQQLFSDSNVSRVIVNIGGIANITVLPATQSEATALCFGYDTGPGNVLLDSWVRRHRNTAFDENGNWGAGGELNNPLLQQLKSNDYFARPAPKSTGRETFNQRWLDQQLKSLGDIAPRDVQATLMQLTAETIADQINRLEVDIDQVFVCGGGAFNNGLVSNLDSALPNAELCTTADLGLDPNWVEASAFAWLAKRRIEKQTGNLPAVTGASKPLVLGGLYLP